MRVRPSADGTPGRPIAPPTMLVMWTPPRACVDHWIIPPGSVHVGQQWTVHGEVLAGDVVDLRLTAIEKFERDRRQFVVYEARFSIDGTGLVATGRMTGMRRQ